MLRTAVSTQSARWPLVVGALAVASVAAEMAYRGLSGPATYDQFVVGSLAWRGAGKTADLALLVALAGAFAVAYVGLVLVERWLARRLGSAERFTRLLGYACLPFALWSGMAVLTSSLTLDLVRVSAVAVAATCGLVILAVRAGGAVPTAEGPERLAGYGLLAVVCGTASSVTGLLGLNRLAMLTAGQLAWLGRPAPYVLAAMAGGVSLGLVVWALGGGERSERRLCSVLLVAQALLPLGYLLIVPSPWLLPDGTPQLPIDASRIGPLALVLVAAGWVDLLRRVPALQRRGATVSLREVLSPLALVALLVAIKISASMSAVVPADDYHFGEDVLPWYLLSRHGQLPYVDHTPARGLINYLAAGLATLAFDGTVPAILSAVTPLVSVLMVLGGVAAVSQVTGLLPAVAIFLPVPLANELGQLDLVNTAALCLLVAGLDRWRPHRWLIAWVAVGTACVLFALGQGGLLVVATVPLGIVQAGRAWLDHPRQLARTALGVAVSAAVLALLTPLGAMILGGLRYVGEHSAVNAVAHGVEWSLGFGAGPLPTWPWEALRAGWMAVALAAAVLVVEAVRTGDRPRMLRVARLAVPIGVLAVLFIFRAVGRIDPALPSRLAQATDWMWTLLLPLLVFAAWAPARWHTTLALTFVAGGVWGPILGAGVDLRRFAERPLETSTFPATALHGDRIGLPLLGTAEVAPEHLARLGSLKRALDSMLGPDETYLDLTNRNAQYAYMDRPTPIESGAVYNLPHEVQQLRAIDRLAASPVPVVLAAGDAANHDGGPASLRAHGLYRYVTGLGYRPVRVGALVLLADPAHLTRGVGRGLMPDGGDEAALLDLAFRPGDLGLVPDSWGRSWGTLSRAARAVRPLGAPTGLHDLDAAGSDAYRVAGGDPFVAWSLTPVQDGRAAGVLTFDFACLEGNGDTSLEIYWGTAAAGPTGSTGMSFRAGARLVVPLDAAPRWLLQPAIAQVRIDVGQPDRCPAFRVANAVLWQRRLADEVEARLQRYH